LSRPARPDRGRGVAGASAGRSSGLPSSRARFDARAARVRRRPWRLSAWLAVVLAAVAGGVWLVDFSSVLVARTVRVEGVQPRDIATVVDRAAVPMGTPLARISTLPIARRVILWPALAEVTVSRSWPGTIVISATPRVPVLAVKNPQGQVKVVDSQGVAYATVSEPPKGVPLIDTVENPSSIDSMRAAMTVLKALSSGQRGQVSKVTVLGPNMVTLKLGGVTVVWGGASEPELIDVSAPRTPVIR
jgi:cell division protein FtsQ